MMPMKCLHGVSTSKGSPPLPKSIVVDDAYLEFARRMYVPPRRPPKGGGGGGRPTRLSIYSYGDKPSAAVQRAARAERKHWISTSRDRSSVVEYSWGPAADWREGEWCLWVAREGIDEDQWLADPPARCLSTSRVGGRSPQHLYWWITPMAEPIPYGQLRRAILMDAKYRLKIGSGTTKAEVVDAVFRIYGLEPAAHIP